MKERTCIGIIGPPYGGKSVLFSRLINSGKPLGIYHKTLGFDTAIIDKSTHYQQFYSFGGGYLEFGPLSKPLDHYFNLLDIVIVVYAVDEDVSLNFISNWIERIAKVRKTPPILIMVGHKSDLKIESGTEIRIKALIKQFNEIYDQDIPHLFTSALDMTSIAQLNDLVFKIDPRNPDNN